MIIKSAEFVTSATRPTQYPLASMPEIAFSGRSNVGKSSLINILVNRKHLVKTSRTPGRTQLVNFFVVNKAFACVDLPGYGYARVPQSVKKNWGPMIETYLTTRETLKGVVLIMDIRRTPKLEEKTFMGWLNHYDIPGILVLTKTDKLSKSEQRKQQRSIANLLSVARDDLILFSAKTRKGRDEVWAAIEKFI